MSFPLPAATNGLDSVNYMHRTVEQFFGFVI